MSLAGLMFTYTSNSASFPPESKLTCHTNYMLGEWDGTIGTVRAHFTLEVFRDGGEYIEMFTYYYTSQGKDIELHHVKGNIYREKYNGRWLGTFNIRVQAGKNITGTYTSTKGKKLKVFARPVM